MEINHEHPLVSVAVIAYNSAEYILETLESVKAQTYDNIELVISDDCSKDSTVELCRQWTAENRSRFSAVHIVQSPVNTGQSGNYNRAFDSCAGEWIKEIDGDDKLLPNCVSDFLDFVMDYPEARCIFGKVKCFGGTQELHNLFETQRFKYDFFTLSVDQQLHRLVLEGYNVPSPGYFYNRMFIKQLGLRNDERIPFMEDYPKWINLLKLKVKFYFLDKEVAEYRLGSGVSTQSEVSVEGYRNAQLFNVYYKFPELVALGEDEAIRREVEELTNIYRQKIMAEQVRYSHTYRLGKKILRPIKWITSLFDK